MKRSLYFAWFTAVVGVVCANRRPKDVLTPDNHCVWFVRPGGHQVVGDTSFRIAVQPERRLARMHARQRKAPSSASS